MLLTLRWILLVLLSRFSHVRQPSRLPGPWDSPDKNTGMGCHFLLQCMKVKSESEVAQSCLTLCDPMDCSPQGSSVHGIFQARVLEWVAIDFSEEVPIIFLFDKNARSYWTNIYSWVPAIVCLHVQEFGKDQQKHSVKINWLHQVYNKRCCIFYYYS